MRAVASKRVLKHRRDGRFALTSIRQALRSDVPGSVRDMILFVGYPSHREVWRNPLHSVRTGELAPKRLRGMSFFDYLDTNTELATVCNNAMTAMSATAMDALVVANDYAGFERIVDVGGGHGQLLARILSSAPDA